MRGERVLPEEEDGDDEFDPQGFEWVDQRDMAEEERLRQIGGPRSRQASAIAGKQVTSESGLKLGFIV